MGSMALRVAVRVRVRVRRRASRRLVVGPLGFGGVAAPRRRRWGRGAGVRLRWLAPLGWGRLVGLTLRSSRRVRRRGLGRAAARPPFAPLGGAFPPRLRPKSGDAKEGVRLLFVPRRACARLLALGSTLESDWKSTAQAHYRDGLSWISLADPLGHLSVRWMPN